MKFALSLAILCDIYRVFSEITVLLQKVSCLPHSLYDQFKELLEDYKEMINHMDIWNCPCSTFRDIIAGDYSIDSNRKADTMEVCSWPKFHTDIEMLKSNGKIMHVIQGQLVANPLKDTRIGRMRKDAAKLLIENEIIKAVEKQGRSIITHFTSWLEAKVYRVEDLEVIKNTRVLLGARDLLRNVHSRGASTITNLTCARFVASACEVDSSLYKRIGKEDFWYQYREYMRQLESLAKTVPGTLDMLDMNLLELFLEPENTHLYEGIEAVMSVMVRASFMISVESMVESWISTMEHHSSQRRNLGDVMLHDEMVIAVNSPSLVHCDAVVQVLTLLITSKIIKNIKFLTIHF